MVGRALAIRCWLGRFRGLCRLRQLAIGLKREGDGILLLGFRRNGWVTGVHFICGYLMGVHLIDVHLTSIHLMRVS